MPAYSPTADFSGGVQQYQRLLIRPRSAIKLKVLYTVILAAPNRRLQSWTMLVLQWGFEGYIQAALLYSSCVGGQLSRFDCLRRGHLTW